MMWIFAWLIVGTMYALAVLTVKDVSWGRMLSAFLLGPLLFVFGLMVVSTRELFDDWD